MRRSAANKYSREWRANRLTNCRRIPSLLLKMPLASYSQRTRAWTRARTHTRTRASCLTDYRRTPPPPLFPKHARTHARTHIAGTSYTHNQYYRSTYCITHRMTKLEGFLSFDGRGIGRTLGRPARPPPHARRDPPGPRGSRGPGGGPAGVTGEITDRRPPPPPTLFCRRLTRDERLTWASLGVIGSTSLHLFIEIYLYRVYTFSKILFYNMALFNITASSSTVTN